MNQQKKWYWCIHCQRDTKKSGHTPFCPAVTIESANNIK